MSVSDVHPLYSDMEQYWQIMKDTYDGELAVKKRGHVYLPPTPAMVDDGFGRSAASANSTSTPTSYSSYLTEGDKAYWAYVTRATVPTFVREAIDTAIGLILMNEPKITLPPEMEFMRERASNKNETLVNFYRRTVFHTMRDGRSGIMSDLPTFSLPGNDRPYLALYMGKDIRNWDTTPTDTNAERLNLVVLDESEPVRKGFTYSTQEKYRVLFLGDPEVNEITGDASPGTVYRVAVVNNDNSFSEPIRTPVYRGTAAKDIPFVFVNSRDTLTRPDMPPLLGLAMLVLAIYRSEADLRNGLFLCGQPTLVVKGGNYDENTEVKVGPNAVNHIGQDGDMFYVAPEVAGLAELEAVIKRDMERCMGLAGQFLQTRKKTAESGSALETRLGSATANLREIAINTASALEMILRKTAEWMGLDPETVEVEPNLEFFESPLAQAQDAVYLATAISMGAPYSKQEYHRWLRVNGFTTLDYEDELAVIDEEGPSIPANPNRGAPGTPVITGPTGGAPLNDTGAAGGA